jgi:tetratricopeptide (TPR) repeat protein
VRLLALALALTAATARADEAPSASTDEQEARAAYRQGVQHYNLGEYRQAAEQFKTAYRLAPKPLLLINIGQCQRQLGERGEAILYFRAYLREEPDSPRRAEVEQIIADLERAPTAPPPQAPQAQAPALAATQSAPAAKSRWPIWVAVGAALVVVAAVVVGVVVARTTVSYPALSPSDGTVRF